MRPGAEDLAIPAESDLFPSTADQRESHHQVVATSQASVRCRTYVGIRRDRRVPVEPDEDQLASASVNKICDGRRPAILTCEAIAASYARC